jgi:hypothetical protein
MTIVTYAHRPKRQRKPKARPALTGPAIVTARKKRAWKLPEEQKADPEAEARLVEFFKGMGLNYVPPEG